MNHLDNQLNEISEQNEALREQCGLGEEESVDVGPLRARRNLELEQLRKDKEALEQQVCVHGDVSKQVCHIFVGVSLPALIKGFLQRMY